MTETQAIIDSYRRASAENLQAALATVVSVEGSAYRRPGVRMFITETGQTTGVLSGGCLERDVCERAMRVMRTGEPVVVRYDTTSDDDIVWGLGIGCNGVVQVLIEPASGERLDDLIQLLAECSKNRRRGALATVIHTLGETETKIGARSLLYPDDATEPELFTQEVVGASLRGRRTESRWQRGRPRRDAPTMSVFDDLREAVQNGRSMIKRYKVDTASVEVFIEVIEPQVPLVIFGAGDDALPVVAFARSLGWHTTVVDTRARPTIIERFADVDAVVLCRPEEVGDRVPLTESTAVVLMTHNYLHDLELLKTLLNSRVRYLGCLGPKRRTERLLSELSGGGLVPADPYFDQLYAPAGVDIGAETPLEIALSIIAEIKAVLIGRVGGLLRNRIGSIHTEVTFDQVSKTRSVMNFDQPFKVGKGQQSVSVA